MGDSARLVRGTTYGDAKSSCAPGFSGVRRSAAAPDLSISWLISVNKMSSSHVQRQLSHYLNQCGLIENVTCLGTNVLTGGCWINHASFRHNHAGYPLNTQSQHIPAGNGSFKTQALTEKGRAGEDQWTEQVSNAPLCPFLTYVLFRCHIDQGTVWEWDGWRVGALLAHHAVEYVTPQERLRGVAMFLTIVKIWFVFAT